MEDYRHCNLIHFSCSQIGEFRAGIAAWINFEEDFVQSRLTNPLLANEYKSRGGHEQVRCQKLQPTTIQSDEAIHENGVGNVAIHPCR